jgi:non-specific protein-tyrosine kinase
MPRILLELEQRADIVLVDTPPLLSVTDASILARICGGTLLVARCGRTRREQVTRAVERLEAVDAGLLGTVLNFAPANEADQYAPGHGRPPKPRNAPSPASAPAGGPETAAEGRDVAGTPVR